MTIQEIQERKAAILAKIAEEQAEKEDMRLALESLEVNVDE